MSEYSNVEKPFLKKLEQLGWEPVVDQGEGIPQDASPSFRKNFKEVVLENKFKEVVKKINLTEDGKEWLIEKQLNNLFIEITSTAGLTLQEANKKIHNLLLKGSSVDKNEVTGRVNPPVKFIDFKNPENNSFIAVNQFRIDTPGTSKSHIRPDLVLFVNGLPLIVIECKDEDYTEPLSEAFIQINRYGNLRADDFGLKEGEERLFHYNLFNIITHGKEARFGTISADFDYYYNWKDIFPEDYQKYKDKAGQQFKVSLSPEERQEVLIHGMLNKNILIDILKHFTIFVTTDSGKEIKIVCRYQQYRAVLKIIQSLRTGASPFDRSGVIWHTQGSGKSLTMVFLIRKIRSCEDLREYKIILVNDRTDLEEQLSESIKYTGEPFNIIDRRDEVEPELKHDIPDLNMVMIHKFLEEEIKHSAALMKAYVEEGVVPEFNPFPVVNKSDKILILIDEAHRTQGGDMSDNLFHAFPESTKIAFTGTPLLTERHKKKTHEKFGKFIDTYKMKDSVSDRATLDILYIGRTSKDQILNKAIFQSEFEDMFRNRKQEEIEEIKRRYGGMEAYLSSMNRIETIAKDIIEHYTREILPEGFKAQVVASSILAATRYKYKLQESIKAKIELEKNKSAEERDDDLIKQMEFCKIQTWVTSLGNNEPASVTAARKEASEIKAIKNFKKDFDYQNPETGVAILCVCDRLITGFDAPIEQVMYLDKNLREHDLLQAIARVNRPKGSSKKHGIVIDYYGVSSHLKEALAIYNDDKVDEEVLKDLSDFFRDMNKELPVLEARYKRLIEFFKSNGISEIEDFVNQNIEDKDREFDLAEKCVELAKSPKFRGEFDVYLKNFFSSLNLLFNVGEANKYWIPAKRFGYLFIRIRNRYKDDTMDLKWAGEKVRKLIDKYLQSLGIDSKIPPVLLMSDEFPKEVDKFARYSKSKASEMEHAIRRHIKVKLDKDPAFYKKLFEKLENIIKEHADDYDRQALELEKLREEIKKGREEEKTYVSPELAPFFDLIIQLSFISEKPNEKQMLLIAVLTEVTIKYIFEAFNDINIWEHDAAIGVCRGKIKDELYFSSITEISQNSEKLTYELLNLAKSREYELRRIMNV
jgi:type I restriction enzyme R subunit